MTTKLIQKQLLRGSSIYEVDEEQVTIHIKSPFKEEKLTVTLAVLDPEPVITRTQLQFMSRVNGEPLISLALSKPNVADFNAFVNLLKQRAQAEYDAISGIRTAPRPSHSATQSHEQPPEFDETTSADIVVGKKVEVESLKSAVMMLNTYVTGDEVKPLIVAINQLIEAPDDKSRLIEVATLFNSLESTQGAVLTYAPYIGIMLSDDPFEY